MMSKDRMRAERGRNTVTVATKADVKFVGLEEKLERFRRANALSVTEKQLIRRFLRSDLVDVEQLLPGIPNEITLAQIAPKLPWTTFHILSSVSPCWREAIQSHQVYDTRVCANSTETLVAHIHEHGRILTIAFYSMEDKCCYELPPIPEVDNGLPSSCKCISLDGKVYVFGGKKHSHVKVRNTRGYVVDVDMASAKVYMFNVAGQGQWKRCASMQKPRQAFGCGIINGKIYVIEGNTGSEPVRGSEVYDPKLNTWSSIEPMPSWRSYPNVATSGEELFVSGGEVYDREYFYLGRNRVVNGEDDEEDHIRDTGDIEAYNPAKNEWRLVDSVDCASNIFITEGKLYNLEARYGFIDGTDIDRILWKHRQTASFAAYAPEGVGADLGTCVPQAINGEIFAVANFGSSDWKASLIQSKGFNSADKRVLWQITNCPRSSFEHGVFPIQL